MKVTVPKSTAVIIKKILKTNEWDHLMTSWISLNLLHKHTWSIPVTNSEVLISHTESPQRRSPHHKYMDSLRFVLQQVTLSPCDDVAATICQSKMSTTTTLFLNHWGHFTKTNFYLFLYLQGFITIHVVRCWMLLVDGPLDSLSRRIFVDESSRAPFQLTCGSSSQWPWCRSQVSSANWPVHVKMK